MSDTEQSTQTEDLNNIEEPPPPEPIVKIRKPRDKNIQPIKNIIIDTTMMS